MNRRSVDKESFDYRRAIVSALDAVRSGGSVGLAMYRLRNLGTATVTDDAGAPGPLASLQPLRIAFLAVVASKAGEGVSRDGLAGLFWPDVTDDTARKRVADVTYRLRRALGGSVLCTQADRLLLDPVRLRADSVTFEECVGAGEWQRAIDLYAGSFLDGFYLRGCSRAFEEWVDSERRRLDRLHRRALEGWASDADRSEGCLVRIERWRCLVDLDPCHVAYVSGLARALADHGDPSGALEVARACAERLQDDRNVVPPSSLTALIQRLENAEGGSAVGRVPDPAPVHAARRDPIPGPEPDQGGPKVVVHRAAKGERRSDSPRSGNRSGRWPAAAALVLAAAGFSAFAWVGASRQPVETDASAYEAVVRARELLARYGLSFAGADSARSEYERALSIDPEYAVAHAELSLLHTRVIDRGWDTSPGRRRLARHHARWAIRIEPESAESRLAMAEYYRRGSRQPTRAMELLESPQARAIPRAERSYRQALVYRDQMLWEQSTYAFEKALALEPDHTQAGYQVLFNYLRMGRYDRLEARLREWRGDDPLGPELKELWVAILPAVRDGDFSQIEQLLVPLGPTEPRCPVEGDAFDVCWDLLVTMGHFEAAFRLADSRSGEWFTGYRVSGPADAFAASALALMDRPAEAGPKLDAVVGPVEAAVQANPDDARTRASLVGTYLALGRGDEALREAHKAVELVRPKIVPSRLYELATVQAAVGRRAEAIETLQEYLAVPSDRPLHFIRRDPRFESLHDLDAFHQLVDHYAGG